MFSGLNQLTYLDISTFDISEVSNLNGMFFNTGITSLDLSHFIIDHDVTISYIFANMSKLESIDVSNFNPDYIKDSKNIFYNCSKLTHIKCTQKFKDWCITNFKLSYIPDGFRYGYEGYTWEIV